MHMWGCVCVVYEYMSWYTGVHGGYMGIGVGVYEYVCMNVSVGIWGVYGCREYMGVGGYECVGACKYTTGTQMDVREQLVVVSALLPNWVRGMVRLSCTHVTC